ncbi:unnamed protein product [Clonostachys chloroleuca]|uniref:Ankyrin repeat protein n=1 Tax=Clonostachys chloroleuca TaxID=1926264 RepID=A0AA35PWN6_9HYPO|nr:unnamed protein product [Clonostachys chloroleuca]
MLAKDFSAVSSLSSEGYDDPAKQLLNRCDKVSLWAGLQFAALTDDLRLATDLIQRETALHYAAESRKNDLELINLLLRQPNVDPGARDFYQHTPLHAASEVSNSEAVRLLLQQPSVSVNGVRRDGETALHLACSGPETYASLATMQHLIDAGALLDAVAESYGTPLCDAVKLENFKIASTLIRADSNPGQRQILSRWINMKPRLFEVIKAGIEVEVTCYVSMPRRHLVATPVYVAACRENTKCMKALFRSGARADSVVADHIPDSTDLRNHRTLLGAVLYEILGEVAEFSISEPKLSPKKEKTISLLIKNGARLGRVPGSSSSWVTALGYAFAVDQRGNPSLLNLILKLSTTKNIRKQFLDDFIDKSPKTAADS